MNKSNSSYTLRRIVTTSEMQEALQLRFRTYKKSFPESIDVSSDQNIETDQYDLNSIHFGLFVDKVHGEKLVGYFRMVFDSRYAIPQRCMPNSKEVYHLLKRVTIRCRERQTKKCALYFLQDVQNNSQFTQMCSWIDERSSEDYPLTEVSRMIISKQHRNLRTALQFMAAIFGLYPYMNIPYAILTLDPRKVNCYKRFGLKSFNPAAEYMSSKFGPHHVMYGHYKEYSPVFKNSIESYIKEYLMNGSCRLNVA